MESDNWLEELHELERKDYEYHVQRVDNSDDTSEVIAAVDEYFSIQQEV